MAESLSFTYSLRHLIERRTQTLLTVGGIALVVFVFAATLMLSEGLRKTLSSTGHPDNAMVLRIGATNEIQSGISREHAAIVLAHPAILRDTQGEAQATADLMVLVSLQKRSDGQRSNVSIRGVGKNALAVRPEITVQSGRTPLRGTREIMIGEAIHRKFAGTNIGDNIRLVGTDWLIVGIFTAGNSAFASEIWGDVDIMMPAFHRDRFSTVTAKLADGNNFEAFRVELENDRRLSVSIRRENEFYESLSELLAKFIRIMGGFISVIFGLGAAIGAMITMYGAVSNRVREIGVLRAIGFSPTSIFLAFAKECLLLGLIGGIAGVATASLLMFVTVATTNFSTFSEVAFGFSLTPPIALRAILFALAMGLIGGALPAWRASRLKIIEAIRAH